MAAEPLQFHDVQIFNAQSLGQGAYGAVYEARADQLPCAAKLLHSVFFEDGDPGAPRILQRFEQECRFLSGIRHPNIVQYLGMYTGHKSGLPALLMELMDESLTHFLENSPEPLPYHLEVNLSHDVALALDYLHSHEIVHRDLSSNNVLLIAGSRAKVTDFGMSKLLDTTQYIRAAEQTLCPGTMAYMSPEALKTPPVYNKKLDCFSFGVLSIQIMTRKFPDPGPPRQFVQGTVDLPVRERKRRKSHIDSITPNHPLLSTALRCLEYYEKNRPSAQELCDQLATLKEDHQYTQSVQQAQERGRGSVAADVTAKDEQIAELQRSLEVCESDNYTLLQQLQESERSLIVEQERNEQLQRQVQERSHVIHEQERQLQEKFCIIEERERQLREKSHLIEERERQLRLLNDQSHVIHEQERQLQEKSRIIEERERQLREKSHVVEERERQLRLLNDQLQTNEQNTTELQQNLLQKEKTIKNLKESVSTQEESIRELQEWLQSTQHLEKTRAGSTPGLEEQERQLQEKSHVIEERERQLLALNHQLQTNEQITAKLQQNLLQKERRIHNLKESVSAKEGSIQELQEWLQSTQPQERAQASNTPGISAIKWKQNRAPPANSMGRHTGTAASDGSVVYVRHERHTYAYNSHEDNWTNLPYCPYSSSSFVIARGLLTAVGGEKGGITTNTLVSLIGEDSQRKWSEHFPPMPTSRSKPAVVCSGRSLVAAGGYTAGETLSSVEILDTDTLQWFVATCLPRPLNEASLTVSGDNLYLLGGRDQNGRTKSVLTCSLTALLQSCQTQSLRGRVKQTQTLEEPEVWHRVADLPVYRSTCTALCGLLLAIGGQDDSYRNTDAVYKYDPTKNTWSIISHMRRAFRWALVAPLPGNKLVVCCDSHMLTGSAA